MDLEKTDARDDCAGEGQQKFNRQTEAIFECSPQRPQSGHHDVDNGKGPNVVVDLLEFLLRILRFRVEVSSWRTAIMNEFFSIYLQALAVSVPFKPTRYRLCQNSQSVIFRSVLLHISHLTHECQYITPISTSSINVILDQKHEIWNPFLKFFPCF
jgi:hypothetical protein